MTGWIWLIGAVLLEVAGTTSMKVSAGFTRFWPSVFIFVFYALSFIGLTLALKTMEVTVAYAVWSALGTAVIAVIGVLYFREAVTAVRVASLVLIVVGVVGLNLSGGR